VSREWEIWDEGLVGVMAKQWHDPNFCVREEKVGRHWNLIKMGASLVEGDSILDVACGFGHLFALLRDRDYLGIDSSEYMVKQARKFFPDDENRFQLGDAYDLSAHPMFDTVIAIGLLHHLPDPEPVIKQLWSKAEICVVFTVWLGKSPLKHTSKTRDNKYLIQRRDNEDSLNKIFDGLEGLHNAESFPFDNPVDRESNHFFKLLRRSEE